MEMALEKPALDQVRVANELTKHGFFVSPTGVRSVWLRHDLETFRMRLNALDGRAFPCGVLLQMRVRPWGPPPRKTVGQSCSTWKD